LRGEQKDTRDSSRVGDGRFDARDIVFPVTLGSAAILEKDQDFEFCSLQRRGWVPMTAPRISARFWLFERLLVALRGRILPLRFNGLYRRAAPSNASELTGYRTEAFSRGYGWIDRASRVVRNRSAVGSRQQNRLAYRIGFSVEFRTRLTKDWDILNVRAMATGLIPARNDARMRFAFPSGISSIALVVLSETDTDWSFAEVPATGGVAPFFFASP
jgi:hypothetical protein